MINIIWKDPIETWAVRIAQADAAMTQQAYWIVRAHNEDLVPQGHPEENTGRVYTLCPECGINTAVDEDGLCISCGATAVGTGVDWLSKELSAIRDQRDRAIRILRIIPPERLKLLERTLDRLFPDDDTEVQDDLRRMAEQSQKIIREVGDSTREDWASKIGE